MRPRGSRQTASSCSCSRRPSRRAWLSLCPRTRCACTTPRSSPCRTCSRGLTTRPRSPASRPWRRPASEPVCYSLRDPRPGPSQGVSRPPRARTLPCPPPQTTRLRGSRRPSAPARAPRPFSFGWKRRRERAGKGRAAVSQMPTRSRACWNCSESSVSVYFILL